MKEHKTYKERPLRPKHWEEDTLNNYGIKYLKSLSEIKVLLSEGAILCSRCSAIKTVILEKAVPKDFYLSNINKNFYKWCEFNNFEYAILSDLYGLHWFDVEEKTYDIHPSSLTEEDFHKLSTIIRKRVIDRGYKSLIFYNTSPVMSKPYFYMMYLTGLPVYFITKLHMKKINLL